MHEMVRMMMELVANAIACNETMAGAWADVVGIAVKLLPHAMAM